MRFKLGNDPVSTYLEACYLLLDGDEPIGRLAFYENPGLIYENEGAACIGSYECIEDLEASDYLISCARKLAQGKGYAWLIGPMEGSTWNNYRFSKDNQHRNFFMEPYHHTYYNQQFLNAGFEEIADYYSNRDQTLDYDREELDNFERYCLDMGAVFRKLNMNDLKKDLTKIAQFSLDGFANNFLYTPIAVEAFVEKYEKLKHLFNPDLVWIVEDLKGEMQAFVFAIKDYMDPLNETVIVKSMVRRRSSPLRGIGSYLAGKIVQIAKDTGYKKVVHALMIRDNASMQISKKFTGDAYKSYALYGLKL
jgi:L-amino acid N-acyltransferase YncA